MASLYMRADEIVTRNATVTTTVGATDTDYTDEWLCDGRANRPAKATTGTVTWSLAFASASIQAVVVANHNIEAGRTITLASGITATFTAPAVRSNGIPYNALYYPGTTLTGITGFSVGVASNPVNVVIGEVIAGPVRTFPQSGPLAAGRGWKQVRRGLDRRSHSVNPYDDATASRLWHSEVYASTAHVDEMMAAFEAQRNGSRLMVFIPDSSANDAWLVEMDEPDAVREGLGYRVNVGFAEVPRVRW